MQSSATFAHNRNAYEPETAIRMFHAERPAEAADQAHLAHSLQFPPSAEEPALRLISVSKAFGNHSVLDNISLDVPKGSIHGIIGKSGAGKTTLIRIAGLLETPDSGTVLYEGINVPLHQRRGKDLLAARRKAGFVFQNFNLFASRSAAGNIAFPLEAAGWPKPRIRNRVHELLELVGLADKAGRPASRLSGGEKQRVAIARAIAHHPSILFSDEATSALDPETTRSVLDLILNLRDTLGLTVVMVTHQMEVVRRICDSVSVIAGGSIVEEGIVSNVFAHPRTHAAKALIEEANHD